MSIRRFAMKRAHRKSVDAYQVGKEDDLNGAEEFDITESSSNTCRRGDKKSKATKEPETLPLAQSTMIYNSSDCTPMISMDQSCIVNAPLNNVKGPVKKVVSEQISSQTTADVYVEYQLKYARLCGIVEQFKTDQEKIKEDHRNLFENFKNSKTQWQSKLYDLEVEKFKLEEELQRVKNENEELKNKLSHKNDTSEQHTQTLHDNTNKPENHTIVATKLSSADRRNLTRSSRKSLLNESPLTVTSDSRQKLELYEHIILDQEDIMDFYSLLAGTSIWKPRGKRHDNDGSDETKDADEITFPCKVQLKNHLEGYEFQMSLNLETCQVSYTPPENVEDGIYYNKLPDSLKNKKSYDADNACSFVSEICEKFLEDDSGKRK